MPTYIEGDIPVGSVQSGELVLKNVVIETALPYKPPSEGSIRGSVACEGDTCRINPDYVPSADDRAVLFLPAENLLLTADGTDAMAYLSQGWKLVGVFDRATAETVADRIAANPPVDNNVIQLKRFMRRFAVTGAVMATAPVAKIALITGREKMLSDDVALGRITPPDPVLASRDLSQSAQLGEQGWRHAQATAAQIDAALEGGTLEYASHYLLTDPSVQVGGEMSTFFSMVRDRNGNLVRTGSIDPKYLEVFYVQPPYAPLYARHAGRNQIVLIARFLTGMSNPFANAMVSRAQEWSAANPSRRVWTNTQGDIRRG